VAGFRLSVGGSLVATAWRRPPTYRAPTRRGGANGRPPAPGPPESVGGEPARALARVVGGAWQGFSSVSMPSGLIGTQCVAGGSDRAGRWRSGGSRRPAPLVIAVEVPFSPAAAMPPREQTDVWQSFAGVGSPGRCAFAIIRSAASRCGRRKLLIDSGPAWLGLSAPGDLTAAGWSRLGCSRQCRGSTDGGVHPQGQARSPPTSFVEPARIMATVWTPTLKRRPAFGAA